MHYNANLLPILAIFVSFVHLQKECMTAGVHTLLSVAQFFDMSKAKSNDALLRMATGEHSLAAYI